MIKLNGRKQNIQYYMIKHTVDRYTYLWDNLPSYNVHLQQGQSSQVIHQTSNFVSWKSSNLMYMNHHINKMQGWSNTRRKRWSVSFYKLIRFLHLLVNADLYVCIKTVIMPICMNTNIVPFSILMWVPLPVFVMWSSIIFTTSFAGLICKTTCIPV